jgi:DNA-binding NarL/FixJ family response regulator
MESIDRIPVLVRASDPISQAGVIAELRMCPGVQILGDAEAGAQRVSVVVVDELDETAMRLLRLVAHQGDACTVLVATRIDDAALVRAIEIGVVGIVRRAEATTARLVAVIRASARGEGAVPPDLLGRLLVQMGRLQRQVLAPRGLTFAGLAQREIDVLRLVADGYDTSEIATELAYSERTVKNVLHDITSRMQLRNRSQAVAYAIREGLI